RLKTMPLPKDRRFVKIAGAIEAAMKAEDMKDVRQVCDDFLGTASDFYQVPRCSIRVLAARPLRVREHSTTELFGDYRPDTMQIRVWMRTAVRRDITSFGTFLSTLCHEFCHHLDFLKFGFSDSWPTRGFYERTAALYHHAVGHCLRNWFGRHSLASAGGSIGRAQTEVRVSTGGMTIGSDEKEARESELGANRTRIPQLMPSQVRSNRSFGNCNWHQTNILALSN